MIEITLNREHVFDGGRIQITIVGNNSILNLSNIEMLHDEQY
jgi:hypothetical protein